MADHGTPKQAENPPSTLLKPSVARIDFGAVVRAGHKETTVWIRNNGAEIVEVVQISTSCECFQVTLERKVIAPGERVQAIVKVDFAHEPSFMGRLGLRAEGSVKASTEPAFVIWADVTVK